MLAGVLFWYYNNQKSLEYFARFGGQTTKHAYSMSHAFLPLSAGDFVRVSAQHSDVSRAGKDGQVFAVDDFGVALIFGVDRAGREQHLFCAGPEQWDVSELDLHTVDRCVPAQLGSSRATQLPF